jgi:hypothetical protein
MVSINQVSSSETPYNTTKVATFTSTCDNICTLSSYQKNHMRNIFVDDESTNGKTVKSVASEINQSNIFL